MNASETTVEVTLLPKPLEVVWSGIDERMFDSNASAASATLVKDAILLGDSISVLNLPASASGVTLPDGSVEQVEGMLTLYFDEAIRSHPGSRRYGGRYRSWVELYNAGLEVSFSLLT